MRRIAFFEILFFGDLLLPVFDLHLFKYEFGTHTVLFLDVYRNLRCVRALCGSSHRR